MAEDQGDFLFKLLVVGEKGVGKTCIIRQYVHGMFHTNAKPTIGVDFALKMVRSDQGQQITLQIWDIAGQERDTQMCRVYYNGAFGAFVVYDVTNPASFAVAAKWKEDIDEKARLRDGAPIPCILIGNKCDLAAVPERSEAELQEFCKEHGFAGYMMTSAKDKINIDVCFKKLVDEVLKVYTPPPTAPVRDTLGLTDDSGRAGGRGCCGGSKSQ